VKTTNPGDGIIPLLVLLLILLVVLLLILLSAIGAGLVFL
jgi:hypothetical protein